MTVSFDLDSLCKLQCPLAHKCIKPLAYLKCSFVTFMYNYSLSLPCLHDLACIHVLGHLVHYAYYTR